MFTRIYIETSFDFSFRRRSVLRGNRFDIISDRSGQSDSVAGVAEDYNSEYAFTTSSNKDDYEDTKSIR